MFFQWLGTEVGDHVFDACRVHAVGKAAGLCCLVLVPGDDNYVRLLGDEVFYGDVALFNRADLWDLGHLGLEWLEALPVIPDGRLEVRAYADNLVQWVVFVQDGGGKDGA